MSRNPKMSGTCKSSETWKFPQVRKCFPPREAPNSRKPMTSKVPNAPKCFELGKVPKFRKMRKIQQSEAFGNTDMFQLGSLRSSEHQNPRTLKLWDFFLSPPPSNTKHNIPTASNFAKIHRMRYLFFGSRKLKSHNARKPPKMFGACKDPNNRKSKVHFVFWGVFISKVEISEKTNVSEGNAPKCRLSEITCGLKNEWPSFRDGLIIRLRGPRGGCWEGFYKRRMFL